MGPREQREPYSLEERTVCRGRQRESRRRLRTVTGAGKKKTLLNGGSCSKKRSWTKNLQQLLEVPASRKIKQSCVLFHKAYI